MKIRKRILPEGWYPYSEKEIRRKFETWERAEEEDRTGVSCIVPHAGWIFSGKIAYHTISMMSGDIDTVVIVGGHLPANAGVLAASEDGYDTPLGMISADLELRREIDREIPLLPDAEPDNTVEILLPIIAGLFPGIRALWMRAPQSLTALKAAEVIRNVSTKLGRKVAIVGSTDLTHYGTGYGFTPEGRGEKALQWMKTVNDAGIIDSFITMDYEGVLYHALERRAACSAGGAITAMKFAETGGIEQGELVEYYTSADVFESDSFVGYAGIIYA